MGEKQCVKCGEMVDEAKAFCPGCGNAFVEEKKRTSVSDFDLSDHTVRLGDSMYNQMLSEMGLSISKESNRDETRNVAVERAVSTTPASSPERSAEPSGAAPASGNRSIIIVIAVVAIALVILAAIVIVAAAAYLYLR
jgi:predicted  nucleic acid-binding Zn-ribbon protein